MMINMNDSSIDTIEDIKDFLNSSQKMEFDRKSAGSVYGWIETLLVRFRYMELNKPEKGLAKKYIEKLTGYSRSQVTRLVKQYVKTGHIKLGTKSVKKHRFNKKYSDEDIKLAAQTSLVHNKPNGIALRALLKRAHEVFREAGYKTIRNISVSYLYVVMNSPAYKRIAGSYEKTKPSVAAIGERRKPAPNGMPGYLRVDSVHQGDLNGVKGVYHIDVVDEVTQWQCVVSVPEINMTFMTIALETLINVFPFTIHEIHSDNGSEYINKDISKMLTSLVIKMTKNRARHCNDNALCESKHNIIRSWVGYIFMDKNMYVDLNSFYLVFNEYLNFHRCCLFPTNVESKTKPGKIVKVYRAKDCMTPFERLKSLPSFEGFLKPGVTVESLSALERKHTDYQMAEIVQGELAKVYKVLSHAIVPARSGSFID
jgi:hypothetical protein